MNMNQKAIAGTGLRAEAIAKLRKEQIAKEIFSPVIKKFQRIQIQTHYKDECWSIDLIDRSSLSKYNKNYKFILTIIDSHTKYAWAIPLKDKSGKIQLLHSRIYWKLVKENLKKCGVIEVKSFTTQHFWISLKSKTFKYIQPIQI